jgi:hypothetical protein
VARGGVPIGYTKNSNKEDGMIMYCDCKHEGQDELQGKGKRVFNKTGKKFGEKSFIYRCTVCGHEKVGKVLY